MLEEELLIICKNKNKKWPNSILFKRFIDNGFGILNGNKKDVQTWVKELNNLCENIVIFEMSFGNHVAYMNLYTFNGNKFYETGTLSIKVYQKPEI